VVEKWGVLGRCLVFYDLFICSLFLLCVIWGSFSQVWLSKIWVTMLVFEGVSGGFPVLLNGCGDDKGVLLAF